MKWTPLLFGLLFCANCKPVEMVNDRTTDFEEELQRLQEYFHIPGLAAIVKKDGVIVYENYFGYADLEKAIPLDSSFRFPIASVTKTFAATLLMQLQEAGKLNLEDPLLQYLEGAPIPATIKLKHILSHTSEGEPGSFFNYSGRFSALTAVIEQASNTSLPTLVDEKILQPGQLKRTVPLLDQEVLDSLGAEFAQPYTFDGEIAPGHFDPGFSTASGLSSTVRDLARFDDLLRTDQLISAESKAQLFMPFISNSGRPLPYGYGVFVQEFLEEKLVWSYGQEDCFSSLFLKVPDKDITLILLANNNLMSDPARLINGDITYSLFALNFLKNYVFELPRLSSVEGNQSPDSLQLDKLLTAHPELAAFYRQELLAQAIAASFIGHVDPAELQRSARLVKLALQKFPDIETYGNNSLMQFFQVLSTYGQIRTFDMPFERLGNHLIERYPYDPYANVYLGFHYANLGQLEKALPHLKNIIEAENFRPFWYTIEAYDFLGDYYRESDPEQAKNYYQNIVDIGWNMGGKLDKAKKAISELSN